MSEKNTLKQEPVPFLENKHFIMIPKKYLTAQSISEDSYYVLIYSYLSFIRTDLHFVQFSLGNIIYDLLGFEEKKNKPKGTIQNIISTLNNLQRDGIIEMPKINDNEKMTTLIRAYFLNEIKPDGNYVKFYADEFMAIQALSTNCFEKSSINIPLLVYLYVKGNTFNGSSACTQSAVSMAGVLGCGKTAMYSMLNLLFSKSELYSPLLIKNRSFNGTGEHFISYTLNDKFKRLKK